MSDKVQVILSTQLTNGDGYFEALKKSTIFNINRVIYANQIVIVKSKISIYYSMLTDSECVKILAQFTTAVRKNMKSSLPFSSIYVVS